jgi:hypothetical protein
LPLAINTLWSNSVKSLIFPQAAAPMASITFAGR